MSLIWRPEDGSRPAPKVMVHKAPPRPIGQTGPRYGVVDTTFSTVNMGDVAVATLQSLGIADNSITRRTVPGFKDLAVAAKQLIESGCHIVVACGMVGPEPIDKQCGNEASLSIAQAQLMTSTHILEVFVHMDEARNDAELLQVTENRVSEHAINAFWLLEKPEELLRRAGTGQRQGFGDVGPADARRSEAAHLRPTT